MHWIIAASLGLATSLMMKVNLEVIMNTNIAVNIAVISLVAGTGFLGSLASVFPGEERANFQSFYSLSSKRSPQEVRFLLSP